MDNARQYTRKRVAIIVWFAIASGLSSSQAMASGCVPVVTNVGPMTNMIPNGYNGLLAVPEPQALADPVERVIKDRGLCRGIGLKAAATARAAFSQERWKSQWRDVLAYLIEQ